MTNYFLNFQKTGGFLNCDFKVNTFASRIPEQTFKIFDRVAFFVNTIQEMPQTINLFPPYLSISLVFLFNLLIFPISLVVCFVALNKHTLTNFLWFLSYP